MSRRQFRLQQPPSDPADRHHFITNESQGMSLAPSLAHGTVANHTTAGARTNRQFEWRQRSFVDSDSVHLHPHGPIDMQSEAGLHSTGLTTEGRSAADDSLLQYHVDYRLTQDPQSKFYQPPSSAPSRYRQPSSSHKQRRDRSTDGWQQDSVGGEVSQQMPSINDWHSDNALRSNYFSAGSTAADPLVEVKMQRYRAMKKLDRHTVKGGFNLISKQSKERKLHDREQIVRQKLKEVSDAVAQRRIAAPEEDY